MAPRRSAACAASQGAAALSNFEESRREIWPKACERHRVGRASHLNDDMPSLCVARPAIISRQLVKRDGCGPATQSTPTAETLYKTIHNYRKAGS